MHPGVWALSVTAFAIGVAEFIVVGVVIPPMQKNQADLKNYTVNLAPI